MKADIDCPGWAWYIDQDLVSLCVRCVWVSKIIEGTAIVSPQQDMDHFTRVHVRALFPTKQSALQDAEYRVRNALAHVEARIAKDVQAADMLRSCLNMVEHQMKGAE